MILGDRTFHLFHGMFYQKDGMLDVLVETLYLFHPTMNLKLESTTDAQASTDVTDRLPSMALDSGSPCRNDGV